jgi:outer membrane immunogenic protein
MRKFLLGSVALAAMIASPAMAADMPVKALPPPAPVFYDWSGAYIGFNYGQMWYDVDREYPDKRGKFCGDVQALDEGCFLAGPGNGVGNHNLSDSDHIFGFHAGAQWQWGQWIFGVEAALSACFDECRALNVLDPAIFLESDIASETKITNFFTVGPRLGWAWDRWMIFVTGGAASANLKATYCGVSTGLCGPAGFTGGFGDGQTWNWGWYAGAGVEYMLYRGPLVDVIWGFEYQHWDVDAEDAFCESCVNPGGDLFGFSDTLRARGDLIRSRLTIKTQGWGIWGKAPVAPAVMAKY